MGSETQQLIKVLEELAEHLDISGDLRWHQWVLESRTRLLASDYSGIGHLLSAYGGMGSFNDIYLDSRPDSLRELAWQLAQSIKHNHEIGST